MQHAFPSHVFACVLGCLLLSWSVTCWLVHYHIFPFGYVLFSSVAYLVWLVCVWWWWWVWSSCIISFISVLNQNRAEEKCKVEKEEAILHKWYIQTIFFLPTFTKKMSFVQTFTFRLNFRQYDCSQYINKVLKHNSIRQTFRKRL